MEGKTKKLIIGITIVVALLLIGLVVALVVTRNDKPQNNNVIEDDPYVGNVDPEDSNKPGEGDAGSTSGEGTQNNDSNNNGSNNYDIYYETVTREEIVEAFELNVGWTALNLGFVQNVAADIYAPKLLITKKLVKVSDIETSVNMLNIGENYYYVIEVLNVGNYVAKDVIVTDAISDNFLVANSNDGIFNGSRNISIKVGDIAPQSKAKINVMVKLNAEPGDHSKLTAKDGELILNTAYADGSNILKRPSNTVEAIFKVLKSDVVVNHIYDDREETAQDSETIKDLEIGTDYTAKARNEANYTSTGNQAVTVKDGENIINIYYTRKLADVTVNHIYDDREETTADTEVNYDIKVGSSFTGNARDELHYKSTGSQTITVTEGENVINIYYTRRLINVTVNHIYDDREEMTEDTEVTEDVISGTSYTAVARNEANYASTGNQTIIVTEKENVVNIY